MDDNGHGLREELWGLGRVGMGDRREERERICPKERKWDKEPSKSTGSMRRERIEAGGGGKGSTRL